jgi:hypothetical protein
METNFVGAGPTRVTRKTSKVLDHNTTQHNTDNNGGQASNGKQYLLFSYR